LSSDFNLRQQALDLQIQLDRYRYTYQFEWLGVPIVRLPDDIMVLQELVFAERPDCIVETGIARGGSLILNASLQLLSGLEARVLGVDLDIFPHTRAAIAASQFSRNINLVEGDSSSSEVARIVDAFCAGAGKVLLILDSDHSHAHVLNELEALALSLPRNSLVLVADTVVEEMPESYYPNRHWGAGNSPLTALREFMLRHPEFTTDDNWGRRAVVSEFRDGFIRKTK
jgi:cephalosporin hydroxylase